MYAIAVGFSGAKDPTLFAMGALTILLGLCAPVFLPWRGRLDRITPRAGSEFRAYLDDRSRLTSANGTVDPHRIRASRRSSTESGRSIEAIR